MSARPMTSGSPKVTPFVRCNPVVGCLNSASRPAARRRRVPGVGYAGVAGVAALHEPSW